MNCEDAPPFMVPRLPNELLAYILKLRSKMMFQDRINKLQDLLFFPPIQYYQWVIHMETYPFIGWGRDLDDDYFEINSSDS